MAQKRRNYKKWLWWGGGALLVILIVAVGVVIWQVNNNDDKMNETTESETIEKERQEESDNTLVTENISSDEEVAEKQKVVQYEGDDPNMAETLSGVVTYAGMNDGVLMIRTSIDQYLTEGVCELTLVREGVSIYSDRVDIVGDVSTATCDGFDVPVAGLGGGNVEININLSADERRGVIRGEASF